MLASEDGSGVGHDLLDEGVPDSCPDRGAAVGPHRLWHRSGRDQVVNDRCAGIAGEKPPGNQCCGGTARYRPAEFVDEEGPVGITVESNAQVEIPPFDEGDQIDKVLGVDRVGRVVRERAIRLQVEAGQIGREPVEDLLDHDTRHAVAAVHSHSESGDLRRVDD